MFFKVLLTKWTESLETFKPKNLKFFLLVSLNTLKKTVILLVKDCWWLLLFLILFLKSDSFWIVNRSFYEPSILRQIFAINNFSSVVCIIASLLLYFFSFIAVRPSVENKNLVYFAQYFHKFGGFLVIAMFIGGLPWIPVFWMSNLFFMDSKTSIQSLCVSIMNGIKLVFYYLPMLLILGTAKLVVDYLIINGMKFLTVWVAKFVGVDSLLFMLWDKFFCIILYLFWLFFLCIMSISYIKIKHKDFNFFNK